MFSVHLEMSVLNKASLGWTPKLGLCVELSLFVKVEARSYNESWCHDACELRDQCLHFEIKSVCLSLVLEVDVLGIWNRRGFPLSAFLA